MMSKRDYKELTQYDVDVMRNKIARLEKENTALRNIVSDKELVITDLRKDLGWNRSLVESLRDVQEEIFACSNKKCGRYDEASGMSNCKGVYLNQLITGKAPCDFYAPTLDLKQIQYGAQEFNNEYVLRTTDIAAIRKLLEKP